MPDLWGRERNSVPAEFGTLRSSPPMGTPNVQAPLSASTPTLTTWGMILLAGALLLLGMKAAGRHAAT
jgi:hypothetical protein